MTEEAQQKLNKIIELVRQRDAIDEQILQFIDPTYQTRIHIGQADKFKKIDVEFPEENTEEIELEETSEERVETVKKAMEKKTRMPRNPKPCCGSKGARCLKGCDGESISKKQNEDPLSVEPEEKSKEEVERHYVCMDCGNCQLSFASEAKHVTCPKASHHSLVQTDEKDCRTH